ncbi:MAG: hypothetical protein A2017_12970 [Lentisphaerae bacterium GWF2_44_16]|nr:MAG: hypothetical protein A2017_12970 [Lentisphaerae bacterium GWF2_44_16]
MINRDNGIPKYLQLKDILKNKIISDYRPGSKFMTEQELMHKYNVSCATVAHTMKDLTEEGYFVRKRGSGTFIQIPAAAPSSDNEKLPELFININKKDKLSDPLNWFIKNEIHRGIINNYNGAVRILDYHETIAGMKEEKIRNLILLDPESELMDLLQGYDNKCVIIDHNHYFKGMPNTISYEQLSGVYELMSLLIDSLGHRRIGMINGNTRYHSDRFAAYQIGLRTYDIPFEDELVVKVDKGSENYGYDAMKKLLSLKARPTAVFVDTDIKAVGAIEAARDSGLRVPEDISVAGFDDIPGAGELEPPLTTVKVPCYDIGRAGVKMLLRLAETNTELPQEVLHTKLIIRNSCGKAVK